MKYICESKTRTKNVKYTDMVRDNLEDILLLANRLHPTETIQLEAIKGE